MIAKKTLFIRHYHINNKVSSREARDATIEIFQRTFHQNRMTSCENRAIEDGVC